MFGWFTRERILAIISILAFLISISSWLHMWIYQRRNLKISIVQYYKVEKYHYFLLSFENLSRIPILVSRIKISFAKSNPIQCSLTPLLIAEKTKKVGNEVISRTSTHSIQFPLSIQSLGGTSEFVAFKDIDGILEIPPVEWTFQINTNRGKAFQLKLPYVNPNHLKDLTSK